MITYLIEENRVLKEQLESGGRRLRFTDDQRRRLAAKGKPLGRKLLHRIATIVTPDTILAWHRKLIAAADFFTNEVWTTRGLVRHFTLFVIDIATRCVQVARTTANPTSSWMEQIARNLTDCNEGLLTGKRLLVVDRDAKYSPRVRSILESSGVEVLFTSYLAADMNAYAERFVRSIKSERLDQLIFLGREALVRASAEYATHYHDGRSHQEIGNVLISGTRVQTKGIVDINEELGGLLKCHDRRPA